MSSYELTTHSQEEIVTQQPEKPKKFGFAPGIVVEFSHNDPDGSKVYRSNVIVIIAEIAEKQFPQSK